MLCDAEVDKGALRVGVEQDYVDDVADFEAVLAFDDPAFDRWIEDADVDAFVAGSGDDAVEELADAAREGDGGGPLAHRALNFLTGRFLHIAVLGDRGELVIGIGRGLVREQGPDAG